MLFHSLIKSPGTIDRGFPHLYFPRAQNYVGNRTVPISEIFVANCKPDMASKLLGNL